MTTEHQHGALHQLSAAGRRAVQERGARPPERSLGDWLRERERKGAAISGVSFDVLMTDVADQRDDGSLPGERG
ncbi:MAG: hypothetical protein H0U12_00705 [Thermoleophilaceae bacterium]|nr:hypothetical protein [Thermoleophilaceae bacterium]